MPWSPANGSEILEPVCETYTCVSVSPCESVLWDLDTNTFLASESVRFVCRPASD